MQKNLMKFFFVFLLLFCISSLVHADLAPHPSHPFTLDTSSYPNYNFFYQEEGIGRVYPIFEGSNSVYWMTSQITIYATKENIDGIESMDKNAVDLIIASSVKSNVISFNPSENLLSLTSFDATNKTMTLMAIPTAMHKDFFDCGGADFFDNACYGLYVPAIIIIIIIVVLYFAFKHFKKKKQNK